MTLLNSKSNLSCKIDGCNSFCSLQWQGGDTRYAHLVDLPQYATYEKGDTVITSGFSSFFPAGIPVGVIEETEEGDCTLRLATREEQALAAPQVEDDREDNGTA